eukprot:CAMPEP_0113500068 /NCGR_PEP_ID=MMETSP0014_2-20120614/32104_1 /TAXON_ID=2857 /ORGANISM="Nitzschia sp." /LENGTH=41 /DNA_ID=CAMNT_0000394325 /DNA_START=121 /DNA_END=246 /DNA_ORIENTATION=+ /assembly_acc=CAM_ASM_000159
MLGFDAAAERASYEKGGYPGWFKFKVTKAYYTVKKTCNCCA